VRCDFSNESDFILSLPFVQNQLALKPCKIWDGNIALKDKFIPSPRSLAGFRG